MEPQTALLFSCVHAVTFYLYTANYARLRKNDVYRAEKKSLDPMPLARKITKLAFSLGTLLVFASFWVPSGQWGFYEAPLTLRFSGLVLTFAAFIFLKRALHQLGPNYSPVFDTHKPRFIVRDGLYRFIRHPVYLCNVLFLLGYVLSSSCLWVLLSSLWGWGYMLRSVMKEEKDLAREFPDYVEYQKTSWRLIPYLF